MHSHQTKQIKLAFNIAQHESKFTAQHIYIKHQQQSNQKLETLKKVEYDKDIMLAVMQENLSSLFLTK